MTTQNLPAAQAKHDPISALLSQDAIKRRFEGMLGKKAAGFMSSIISATSANKELKNSDPLSIVQAAAVAAALDLPINPSLGFAHIVPYSGKAQFQMGWRGFVQLGMRTGQYKTINACIVYEGELVSRNRFTGEMEFDENRRDSETIIGYVAYFKLVNGFEKWLYMTIEEVKAHGKKYSKSFDNANGRWKKDFDVMALKTVIKMLLSKWGILSIEMQTAVMADQAVVKKDGAYTYPDGTGSDVVDGEITEGEGTGDEAKTNEQILEDFAASIPKEADPKMVDAFLTKVAEGNKKTVDEVKIAAASDPKELESLWRIFPGWCRSQANNKKTSEDKKSDPTPARFECIHGGFVTAEICKDCKDLTKDDGRCPNAPAE
jgi:recombination protein RecT